MRAFYAVRLPSPKATESPLSKRKPLPNSPLRKALETLAEMPAPVHPVAAENLHLTLKFLGDVSKSCFTEARQILESVAERHKPFQLRITGTGVFPHIRRPRVVWAGVQPAEPVTSIANALDSACTRIRIDREDRAYRPHLTLARLKGPPPDTLLHWLREHHDDEFCSFEVNRLELLQSVHANDGVQYQTVAAAPLI